MKITYSGGNHYRLFFYRKKVFTKQEGDMNLRKIVKQIIVMGMAVMLTIQPGYMGNDKNVYGAESTKADSFYLPSANANGVIGATMPYTRYDTEKASLAGGAVIAKSDSYSNSSIATQASNQSYARLPKSGASVEWTMETSGDGVTMRFTMPDSSDGKGKTGSLDVYVNGKLEKTVSLTSYYMWQYFAAGKGHPSDTNNGGYPLFAFDEVHFKLNTSLKKGDKIKIQSSGVGNMEYGVDFIEVEQVPGEIKQPANSLSVVDYGAKPNDDKDDATAINNCIYAAKNSKKDVYFPAGTYKMSKKMKILGENIKITGAGMWYTNIQFTSDQQGGGGVTGKCKNVEISNMYLNSNLRSRYNESANYKCFADVFEGGSVIHDIWEEHFECGFWLGDYDKDTNYSDGLKIVNSRIRNNLADGVNFCQGTSNAAVYNCSVRNNGDDGLAMWNNDYYSKDEERNVFAYNTIEFNWRAGGIAVYGGNGHKIYNNYICDMTMSCGIHLNTVFSGYKFNNNKDGIKFDNNIIIKSGCSKDSWNGTMAAIDITGGVKNVTFNNTKIYEAQHDGIRVGQDCSNIVFNNTKIYKSGADGNTSRKGAALYLDTAQNVVFNNIEIAKSGYNNSAGWPIYSHIYGTVNTNNIKNYVDVSSKEYTIPSYPTAGTFSTSKPANGGSENPTTKPANGGSENPTTKPTVKPTVKVNGTKVNSASKKRASAKIKISLKKAKSVTGYQIQIATNKKFKKVLVSKKVKKYKFVLKSSKIKNKKTLYLRARAYKVVSKKTYVSNWTKAKKVKVTK